MTPLELACLWRLSPPLDRALALLREVGQARPAEVAPLLEAVAELLLSRARVLRALPPCPLALPQDGP